MRLQPQVLLALTSYDHRLHRAIARYAGQHHWHLQTEVSSCGTQLGGWKEHGMLVSLDHREELAAFVQAARVPVVELSLQHPELPIPRVSTDHHRTGVVAAHHLLRGSFRHLVYYSTRAHYPSNLRWSGFSDTLAPVNHTPIQWLCQSASSALDDPWPAQCRWLIERLTHLAKPSAVFAATDFDAARVLEACLAAGIAVPEEVAILGADNLDLICETQKVPLSSVQPDVERIGFEAAALLDRLMQGHPAPLKPILIAPAGVMVRRSTEMLSSREEACREAVRFLHTHYARNIGVIDVVRVCGLSRRTLERTFVARLGRSVGHELGRIRLAKVTELLLQTDLPVVDIAARAGFRTPQYLNCVFVKATGLTPGSFRASLTRLRHCP